MPSPALRFTAVVVLPTPPFWLATAIIFANASHPALLSIFGLRFVSIIAKLFRKIKSLRPHFLNSFDKNVSRETFLSKNASPISFHMSRAAEASPKTLPVLSPFDSSRRKDPTGDNPSHKVSHVIFVPVKAPATREEELHALRMGKGWRVMQAFGCGLTCALMFHVEHQGTSQLYRKVFRSELLYSPKCFTWNISQLNAEEKFYITSGASNHISGSHFRKILPAKMFHVEQYTTLAFRHEGRLGKLRQGSAPFRRSFPWPRIKHHAALTPHQKPSFSSVFPSCIRLN